jgi:vancomycin resistance protein VanJ
VPPGQAPPSSGPTLRIVSYNTTHTVDGLESLRALVLDSRADLVLFQWTSALADDVLRGPGLEGWTVLRAGQFTVASRFPVRSLEPAGVVWEGYGPPAVHAVVEGPFGPLDVYSIRPRSARLEIGARRRLGMRQRVREFLENLQSGRVATSNSLRDAQTRSLAAEVARARHPVIVAGDTNLPGGSRLLRETLGGLGDAFEQAGWGFGYTYPARLPWMRLDRVLLGPELSATAFEIKDRRVSAHLAVVAEVHRRPGR